MHKDYAFRALWVKGRGGPWQWMAANELERALERMKDVPDKFVSAQFFSSPVRKDGESHWSHLFLDIDDKQNSGDGRRYAEMVVEWCEEMGIPPDQQLWLATGTGGYHGYLSGHCFDLEPSPRTTEYWSSIAALIAEQMSIPTEGPGAHLDLSVYTVPRLMRVPGPRSDAADCKIVDLT